MDKLQFENEEMLNQINQFEMELLEQENNQILPS